MANIWIYPYKMASESVKSLAIFLKKKEGFDAKMIRLENSNYKGSRDKVVVNWGSSGPLPPEVMKSRVINNPEAVALSSNKLSFFRAVTDETKPQEELPRTVPFTQDKEVVRQWLADGKTAFARTSLTGHSGKGIVDVINLDVLGTIRDGTLFTQYVPKKQEWRIHVGPDGNVFIRQRKAYKRADGQQNVVIPDANWRIRNHANGFIFERFGDTRPPEDVEIQAIKAVRVLGLDFGAVDVIYNERREQAYVLEVNTAPGLEASTVEDYGNMIAGLV